MRIRTVDLADADQSLAEYARQANAGPIVVTSGGQPIAAVVPVENADIETVSMSTDPRFVALIERSRTRQDIEGGISSVEMRRRFASDEKAG